MRTPSPPPGGTGRGRRRLERTAAGPVGNREAPVSGPGNGTQRWITVGPAGQPDTSIVLHPAATEPGAAEALKAMITLAADALDQTFDRVKAAGVEVVQEPTEQPWGTRDCTFHDPAGNTVRIDERR